MKQLTCELCGSTNIVKQDGMFICQECGTKYSLEEAKKLLVEIDAPAAAPAPSKTDNSGLISNYYSMARNAMDASNNAEAENYCNKILELDPTEYEAWFIKGKAVGWQSTLANQRISETINAFTNALEHCPEEKKAELGESCKEEIQNLHKALLSVRMKNFMNHPNDNDVNELGNDVRNILSNAITFLLKAKVNVETVGKDLGKIILNTIINNFNKTLWKDYQGDDGKPGDYEFKRFMQETDRCVIAMDYASILFGTSDTDDPDLYEWRALAFDAKVKLNTLVRDACSLDYRINDWGSKTYYKNLQLNEESVRFRNKNNEEWEAKAKEWRKKKTDLEASIKAEKERKEREEAQKALDAYWAEHAEEKVQLEAEREELNGKLGPLYAALEDKVKAIKAEIESVPGLEEIKELDGKINAWVAEKASLGVFKGKEKKALQEQIDQALLAKKGVEERMAAAKKALEDRLAREKAEIQQKINPLQSRINEIHLELTKAR